MTKNAILFADGKPLALDSRVGKGGEGEVYALADSANTLVKVYTIPDLASREAKVRRMIEAGLASTTPLIAFPLADVRDRSGKFVGFTMRRVNKHQALHELYSPGARKAAFPRADYRFLVRSAANIARAVGAAHAAGCVIGDVNHSGILVSDQATAALIDADSFQITDGTLCHLCRVGVPEYTPPEVQGQRLDSLVRTQNHDAFGLAIVIFQLLWMGRHPFSGRYRGGEMSIEKAIAEFRFAYSRTRSVQMEPPPAVPSLASFPQSIGAAFEAAFGPEGVKQRPTAKQWIGLLSDLEQSLRVCPANPLHHFPTAASECPWCRMEKLQGILLFLPPLAGSNKTEALGSSGQVDVEAIWRVIEAVQPPPAGPHSPVLQSPSLSPSAKATATKRAAQKRKLGGLTLLAFAIGVVFLSPDFWILAVLLGGIGVAAIVRKTDGQQDIVRNAKDVQRQWDDALENWQKNVANTDYTRLKAELLRAKIEIKSLPSEQEAKIRELENRRRSDQLRIYLERFQIRRHKFKGIGPAKLATLTSYGIETAADVEIDRVMSVPGFGPATSAPLVVWRQQLEARFTFSTNPTPSEKAAEASIKSAIARKAAELSARLVSGAKELERAVNSAQQKRTTIDPILQRLHEAQVQTQVDLKFLGLSIPPSNRTLHSQPSQPTPVTISRTPSPPATKVASNSCPRCGGTMVLKTARKGVRKGQRFWGCARYPACVGTRSFP